jgi:DNA-binding NtrC family response regulator
LRLLEDNSGNLARTLDYCEREILSAALARSRGNQSQAARALGITPRSVYNKVHKHCLTR